MTKLPDTLPLLLSAKDIQQHVRCSKTEAYELMWRELPTIRIGRLLRVKRQDFLAFIEERVIKPVS